MSIGVSTTYRMPGDDEIIAMYRRVKTIAVIGLSPKPQRPSHYVSKRMLGFGFDIIPVRPAVKEVLGRKAYARLQDIPTRVDGVNVFRASHHVAAIIDQCIGMKIKTVWLQEGVVDVESAIKACNANVFTVMDKCIYKEYVRLMQ